MLPKIRANMRKFGRFSVSPIQTIYESQALAAVALANYDRIIHKTQRKLTAFLDRCTASFSPAFVTPEGFIIKPSDPKQQGFWESSRLPKNPCRQASGDRGSLGPTSFVS